MSIIDGWFSNNNLRINYDKSKFIAFSNKKRTEPLKNEITIHNKLNCNNITCTCPKLIKHPFVKYLGITIDQHLKWNIHIDNLIIRLRQLTYLFIIAKKILDKNLNRITYFAMAQSIMQYGLIAWGGCNGSLKNKLLIRQKYLIKIILNKPKTFPSCDLFKLLRVLTQKICIKKQAICFIYKNNLFNTKKQVYNSRKKDFEIPFVHTKKASMSFLQIGLRSLNEILKELLVCGKYSYFKLKLKNWLYNSL